MSAPTIAYVAAAIVVALVVIHRFFFRDHIKNIRGPLNPSWWLGHEYGLETQPDIGSLEFNWMHEYGATWKVGGLLGAKVLMTADPKAMHHIYQKSGYDYVKRPFLTTMAYLTTGPGIFPANNKDHHRHRKAMNPAFSPAHLRSFLPLFQRSASKMTERWKAYLSGDEQVEFMVNRWLSRVTLDIIGEAAFQYDFGALDGHENNPICHAYDELTKDVAYKPPKAFLIFRASWDYIPLAILSLVKHIPIAPLQRLCNMQKLFNEYGQEMLDRKRSDMSAEKGDLGKDVMSLFIKATSSSDAKTRLSDDEILAQLSTLTFAGHETTASTISFLLYELAKYPEYQARMREEIQEARVRMLDRGDSTFTTEDLDSLTLTVNAIKETLRFHPAFPQLPRIASKDDVLPLAYPIVSTTGEVLTEVPIRKGQLIFTSFAAYQRLPEVWGSDADVWNPDRFMRPEYKQQVSVGIYANLMTFSAGPRGCIGWKFSLIEMQAFLAEMMEHFQFAPSAENLKVNRASAGIFIVPMVEGKEDQGSNMPIRVSLVQ